MRCSKVMVSMNNWLMLAERANIPGVFGNVFVELGKVQRTLFVTHGDSLLVGTGQLFRVPRVDDNTTIQTLGSTSELREDENTVSLLLGCNVLVCDEVHPVTGRRDNAGIRHGVECDKLVKVDGLVEEMNWLELNSAEFPVDATDQLVYHSPQVLILFDILSTWHSHLHQNDLTYPLWVITEEDLQRMELLGHALDVVQAVDTDHELDTLELLLKHSNTLLHLFLLESLLELLGVNANWERAAGNNLALEFNSIRRRCKSPIFISQNRFAVFSVSVPTHKRREQLLRKCRV